MKPFQNNYVCDLGRFYKQILEKIHDPFYCGDFGGGVNYISDISEKG